MAIEIPRTRNIFVYTRLIAIYTVAGLSIILAFMYFCYLARQDLDIASSNGLTLKIGRVAYVYSHGAIQYACGRYDPQLAYILRQGLCKYEDFEYEMAFYPNSAGLRDDEDYLDDPDIVVLGDSRPGTGMNPFQSWTLRLPSPHSWALSSPISMEPKSMRFAARRKHENRPVFNHEAAPTDASDHNDLKHGIPL